MTADATKTNRKSKMSTKNCTVQRNQYKRSLSHTSSLLTLGVIKISRDTAKKEKRKKKKKKLQFGLTLALLQENRARGMSGTL